MGKERLVPEPRMLGQTSGGMSSPPRANFSVALTSFAVPLLRGTSAGDTLFSCCSKIPFSSQTPFCCASTLFGLMAVAAPSDVACFAALCLPVEVLAALCFRVLLAAAAFCEADAAILALATLLAVAVLSVFFVVESCWFVLSLFNFADAVVLVKGFAIPAASGGFLVCSIAVLDDVGAGFVAGAEVVCRAVVVLVLVAVAEVKVVVFVTVFVTVERSGAAAFFVSNDAEDDFATSNAFVFGGSVVGAAGLGLVAAMDLSDGFASVEAGRLVVEMGFRGAPAADAGFVEVSVGFLDANVPVGLAVAGDIGERVLGLGEAFAVVGFAGAFSAASFSFGVLGEAFVTGAFGDCAARFWVGAGDFVSGEAFGCEVASLRTAASPADVAITVAAVTAAATPATGLTNFHPPSFSESESSVTPSASGTLSGMAPRCTGVAESSNAAGLRASLSAAGCFNRFTVSCTPSCGAELQVSCLCSSVSAAAISSQATTSAAARSGSATSSGPGSASVTASSGSASVTGAGSV